MLIEEEITVEHLNSGWAKANNAITHACNKHLPDVGTAAKKASKALQERSSKHHAGKVISQLLPDTEVRDAVCRNLFYYWNMASNKYADRTFISLFSDHVRMTVGMVELFVIQKNHILVVADRTQLNFECESHYLSQVDATRIYHLPNDFVRHEVELRPAIISIMDKLGKTRIHPTARKAHSPGIIQFLEMTYGNTASIESEHIKDDFTPNEIIDARERIKAEIVHRRGQPAFRREMLKAYDSTCAFTGCKAVEVLDAAHIDPYKGEATNHPQNGLLLRTDIHTLFDLGLITIDNEKMTIIVSSALMETEYKQLSGHKIKLPCHVDKHPSKAALEKHRTMSKL